MAELGDSWNIYLADDWCFWPNHLSWSPCTLHHGITLKTYIILLYFNRATVLWK